MVENHSKSLILSLNFIAKYNNQDLILTFCAGNSNETFLVIFKQCVLSAAVS